MEKTAEQIAVEVLSISNLTKWAEWIGSDDFEKIAFRYPPGLAGNVAHVISRVRRTDPRAAQKSLETIKKGFKRLVKQKKVNDLPGSWYTPIKDSKGDTVGYVTGQRAYVTTLLSKNMSPRGQRIDNW